LYIIKSEIFYYIYSNDYGVIIYIIRGKPTIFAPIPNPAPERADTAMEGIYVSKIAKVAAAVKAS